MSRELYIYWRVLQYCRDSHVTHVPWAPEMEGMLVERLLHVYHHTAENWNQMLVGTKIRTAEAVGTSDACTYDWSVELVGPNRLEC